MRIGDGQSLAETLGRAAVAANDFRQPFRKDPAAALRRAAVEPPAYQSQPNGRAMPGEITERPLIPAVNPAGVRVADRTGSARAYY